MEYAVVYDGASYAGTERRNEHDRRMRGAGMMGMHGNRDFRVRRAAGIVIDRARYGCRVP